MYVLVEGVNKQFLRRYFRDVGGNIYDGHSGTDVTDSLPTNGGDHPRDKKRLEALAEAARERDLDRRLAKLEKTLDLDRFLSFMAMETMLWHWDGYTMHRNNFRIFHDSEADRMVFLPQGLDQILSNPSGPVLPPVSGLVARAVLETPEGRRRYQERAAQLLTNVFQLPTITNRLYEVSAKICAALEESDPGAAAAYRQKVNGLRRRFQQRAASLNRQIFPPERLTFEDREARTLGGWGSRVDLGEAQLTREQADDGRPLLRISTRKGCTASWRTTAALDPGRYRFEARIRTVGVMFPEGDPRAGAGLRVSRHRVGQKNDGDRDWAPVTFDFEVSPDKPVVELVCELRALRGDVWFDTNSLRIRPR
jgi:hypothetical protein